MKVWRVLLLVLQFIAWTGVAVAGFTMAYYFVRMDMARVSPGSGGVPMPTATPIEFVTIVLSAVTVVLAALAIVLALAGAIGYLQIRGAAERKGAEVAAGKATEVATDIAAKTAAEKVQELVPRLVETTLIQVGDRDKGAGDEIAKVTGDGDHVGNG
jgi:hypothetical protein